MQNGVGWAFISSGLVPVI